MLKNNTGLRTAISLINDGVLHVKCPHCFKMFEIKLPNNKVVGTISGRELFVPKRNLVFPDEVTCPHCENTFFSGGGWRNHNYYGGYKIFDNGDMVKFNYVVVWAGLTLSKNGKIGEYCTKIRHTIVFNTKTGMTYILPSINITTGKKYGSIMNVSYARDYNDSFSAFIDLVPHDALAELANILFDKLQKKERTVVKKELRDVQGDSWEEEHLFLENANIAVSRNNLKKILILTNKMPHINIPDILEGFINRNWNYIKTNIIRKASDMNLKMPKSIKRACGNNIYKRAQYILLQKELPKLSVDNKLKIISGLSDKWGINNVAPRTLNRFYSYFGDETIATNKLMKIENVSEMYYLEDLVRMMEEIKAAGLFEKRLLKGSIMEIHDNITKIHKLLGQSPLPIEVTKSEKEFECNIGGYSFVCADNTAQLHWTGSMMNICVGSYSSMAIKKDLSIFLVIKNNDPVVCIELRGKRVVQAKAYGNNRDSETRQLEGELSDIVVKWIKINGLTTTCSDIKNEAFEKEVDLLVTDKIEEDFKQIAYDYLEEINKNVERREKDLFLAF